MQENKFNLSSVGNREKIIKKSNLRAVIAMKNEKARVLAVYCSNIEANNRKDKEQKKRPDSKIQVITLYETNKENKKAIS